MKNNKLEWGILPDTRGRKNHAVSPSMMEQLTPFLMALHRKAGQWALFSNADSHKQASNIAGWLRRKIEKHKWRCEVAIRKTDDGSYKVYVRSTINK